MHTRSYTYNVILFTQSAQGKHSEKVNQTQAAGGDAWRVTANGREQAFLEGYANVLQFESGGADLI